MARQVGKVAFSLLLGLLLLQACTIPENPLYKQVKEEVWKTKVSPEIAVTQSATEYLSWGDPYIFLPPIKVNTSGTPVDFRIENRGTAALNVQTIVLNNTTDFSLTAPALPLAVPAGGWETFSVTFTPKSVATIPATVSISSDDADEGTYVLNLSAESLSPVAEISVWKDLTEYLSGGTAYPFGQLPNGVVGTPVTFTIKNSGDTNLSITAMSLGDTTNFALSAPGLPWTITPAGTHTFTVAFQPKSVNTFNSSVTISNNDPDEGTYVFNITGQGTVRDTISVSSTTPANNATDVRIDLDILVVFDRVIDPATITGTTIKKGTTNYTYTSSWNSGTKTLTLNPTSDLPTLSAITVTLPNTITGYNYELFSGHTFSFNTGTAWHDGNTVFVATTGSDANPGTKAQPKRSVQAGLDTAVSKSYTQVYVAEGLYNHTNQGLQQTSDVSGLQIATTTAMSIVGGWNSAFAAYSVNSELNGESYYDHVVWIKASNLTFKNFTLKAGLANGTSYHSYGGGILFYDTVGRSAVTVENVTVDGNSSTGDGGGIYIASNYSNVTMKTTCYVQNNTAGPSSPKYGGGIEIAYGSNITLDGVNVQNNTGFCGGISLSGGSQITIKNCFIYQNTGSSIDGVSLWGGSGITLQNNSIYAKTNYCLILNGNSGTNITSLVITGNQFSSSTYNSATVVAIAESNTQISGHTITNNGFLPNYIAYLYQNYGGAKLADDATGLSKLNTSNDPAHDAATASGNIFVY